MGDNKTGNKAAAIAAGALENKGIAGKNDDIPEVSVYEPPPGSSKPRSPEARYFSPFQSASPSHSPRAAPIVVNARLPSVFPKISATPKLYAKKSVKKPPVLHLKSPKIARVPAPVPIPNPPIPKTKTPSSRKFRRRQQPTAPFQNYLPQFPPFYPYPPQFMQQALDGFINPLNAASYPPYPYPYANAAYPTQSTATDPQYAWVQPSATKPPPPLPYLPQLYPPLSPSVPPKFYHASSTRITANNRQPINLSELSNEITIENGGTNRTGTGVISPREFKSQQVPSSPRPKAEDYPLISGQFQRPPSLLYHRQKPSDLSQPQSKLRKSPQQGLSSFQADSQQSQAQSPRLITALSTLKSPTLEHPPIYSPEASSSQEPFQSQKRPPPQLPINPIISTETQKRLRNIARNQPFRPPQYQRHVEFMSNLPAPESLKPPQPSAFSLSKDESQYQVPHATRLAVYYNDGRNTSVGAKQFLPQPSSSHEASPKPSTNLSNNHTHQNQPSRNPHPRSSTPVYRLYP